MFIYILVFWLLEIEDVYNPRERPESEIKYTPPRTQTAKERGPEIWAQQSLPQELPVTCRHTC